MNSQQTQLPLPQYKYKQFVFAQQIRNRSRQNKLSQMRKDMYVRQKFTRLMQAQNCVQISNFLKESIINEMNGANILAESVLSKNIQIKVQSEFENARWGYILATIIQHRNDTLQVILGQYFHIILKHCKQYKNYSVAYTMLGVCVQSFQVLKTKNKQNQCKQIQNKLQKQIQSCYDISCLENKNFWINQIKFYNQIYIQKMQTMYKLTENPKFIKRLLNQLTLSYSQNCIKTIQQILKLLIFITYYDNSSILQAKSYKQIATSTSPTIVMVTHQPSILDISKFMLEFMSLEHEKVFQYFLILLQNIVQNIGIELVLTNGVLIQIRQIIQNKEHDRKICIKASLLMLSVIASVSSGEYQLQYMKNIEWIDVICFIADRFCKFDNEIVKYLAHAIKNMLEIGQQIRKNENSQINPYLLGLQYSQLESIARQFPILDQLFCQYSL